MWWTRHWSTLDKVMACCLMAPSHYLNQCWLTFILEQFHKRYLSYESLKLVWRLLIKILIKSPRGEWDKYTFHFMTAPHIDTFLFVYHLIITHESINLVASILQTTNCCSGSLWDSPCKGPVLWKGFPCRDVIMWSTTLYLIIISNIASFDDLLPVDSILLA